MKPSITDVMTALFTAITLCLLANSAFSQDWRRVENKDELRGSTATAFFTDGSMPDTSFGVVCFNGKFDHIKIDMGSVLDSSAVGAVSMVKAKYKRDDEKPGGIFESVSKDGMSIEVGKRNSRRMITPTTHKLIIEVPRYVQSEAQTVFTFPDFKPVMDACRGLFKD
jgi:hypothetical protein